MIRVIGDVILDRWISGDVKRISPEAPVPVLNQFNEKYTLGGASNVAYNIMKMGSSVKLYGVRGDDDSGQRLVKILARDRVPNILSIDMSICTPLKTRFVTSDGHHLLRVDNETTDNYSASPHNNLMKETMSDDIVVVSDYAKGLIQPNTVPNLVRSGHKVFVDPKQHPSTYHGAYLVKPNMKEFMEWTDGDFSLNAMWSIMEEYDWEWLVITDGRNGLRVYNNPEGTYEVFKEEVQEIYDVTGAGDVVISSIAHNYDEGYDMLDCCRIACSDATRAVQRKGTCVYDTIQVHD